MRMNNIRHTRLFGKETRDYFMVGYRDYIKGKILNYFGKYIRLNLLTPGLQSRPFAFERKKVFFFWGGGVSDPLCLSSSSALHFF
jgi:hypothetical protein